MKVRKYGELGNRPVPHSERKKDTQQLRLVRDARGWLVREATCVTCWEFFDYETRHTLRCRACTVAP